MSLSLSPSVTLVIKAPNQKIADQKIECTVDWTVQKLKQHLAKVYPTNPMESQQRIIYSGKLLMDNHQLQDVLKQYEPDQNIHTVHLVCMASMSDVSQLAPSSATNLQNVSEDVLSTEGLRRRQPTTEASSSASSPSSQFVGPELNSTSPPRAFLPTTINYQSYHHVPHHPAMMYYGAAATPPPPSSPVMPSFVPGFMPYGAEQLQWMQQAYAQSMMHYMQQFQQATVQPPHLAGHAPPVMPTIPVPLANQNFANDLPGAAAAAAMADPADAPPPLQQGMRMNAQGGRDMDDEDGERGNRDWLDSTYVFVRFLMLMSILYFYSTPQRFIMMLTLALFAYMGRAGWLRRGRRENRNVEQQRQAAAAAAAPPQQIPTPPPQPQQQDAVRQDDDDDTPLPEDVDEETTATNMVDLQATHRLSTFEVIWSVITSFFTSLIPENPPPININ
jgi:hypothetical protein